MKQYIAIITQDGGCDYTIGCGINVISLESYNMSDALDELRETISGEDGEGGYTDELELSNAVLHEVSDSLVLDLKSFYKELSEKKKREEQSSLDKAEYAEYMRLKKKFDK